MKKLLNYINGEFKAPISDEWIDNYNPSNGEVYKASQTYWAVPSSSNLGGRGATFSVFTNPSGGIATSGISTTIGGVQINHAQMGYGYATGETITIEGGLIGGTTPADNISFQVTVGDRGRWKYSLPIGDNPDSIIDPFNPETVGIMQTAHIGLGVSIILDNSGAPRGAQTYQKAWRAYFLRLANEQSGSESGAELFHLPCSAVLEQ